MFLRLKKSKSAHKASTLPSPFQTIVLQLSISIEMLHLCSRGVFRGIISLTIDYLRLPRTSAYKAGKYNMNSLNRRSESDNSPIAPIIQIPCNRQISSPSSI